MTISWNEVKHEFTDFDGSWRDIYVFRTSLLHWQRVMDALRETSYLLSYYRDGMMTELPADVATAFTAKDEANIQLSVTFAGVTANCHFFTASEIEFDIDPREITGQEQFNALLSFMQFLANATDNSAVLTPENANFNLETIQDHIIFQVGNSSHPVSVPSVWLTWNGGVVPKIAQAIYDERAFDHLPILADALEDAGCDNVDIIAHCRKPGPHVRGCWVVDLLLSIQ